MKLMKHKKKKLLLIVVLCGLLALGVVISAVITLNLTFGSTKEPNCQYIYGDGYLMGTDPEPVVIGGSCDGKSLTSEEIQEIWRKQDERLENSR